MWGEEHHIWSPNIWLQVLAQLVHFYSTNEVGYLTGGL